MARSESHQVLRVKSRDGSGVIINASSEVSLVSLSNEDEVMNDRGGLRLDDSSGACKSNSVEKPKPLFVSLIHR
jgi:hypothetical protein